VFFPNTPRLPFSVELDIASLGATGEAILAYVACLHLPSLLGRLDGFFDHLVCDQLRVVFQLTLAWREAGTCCRGREDFVDNAVHVA
jgi:hypothetical protein